MAKMKLMSPISPIKPTATRHKRGFSLGSTVATLAPTENRRCIFLPFTTIVIILFAFLIGTALVIGVRFTRSFHFENRELSFIDSVRIFGDTLLGTGSTLKGESDGRVNILLLGRAGEKYPGRNLTDTIMLLSIDTAKQRIGLLSLPRDLFAPIGKSGLSTKLNSLYQIGLNENEGVGILRESVSHITGQPIQYSAMIDFDGFERMIDALGGIQVEVKRDIYDTRYPGKNYSYETFELSKGWQKLDGKTALKYARERHDDPDGDFGRAKRQQDIMQAVRDRVWSMPTILNPFALSSFLQSLGESITTDIAPEEVGRFVELARKLDTKNVSTIVVDAWKKESLLRVSHINTANGRAFILVPRSGTWSEIQDAAKHLFEENIRSKREATMKDEAAHILIVTTPAYRTSAEALTADLRETFPGASVKLESRSTLEKTTETAIIQDMRGLRTPYTLDSLVARYGLDPGTVSEAATPTGRGDADLVILYTRSGFAPFTAPDTETVDAVLNTPDFQEPLAPQENRFTR